MQKNGAVKDDDAATEKVEQCPAVLSCSIFIKKPLLQKYATIPKVDDDKDCGGNARVRVLDDDLLDG